MFRLFNQHRSVVCSVFFILCHLSVLRPSHRPAEGAPIKTCFLGLHDLESSVSSTLVCPHCLQGSKTTLSLCSADRDRNSNIFLLFHEGRFQNQKTKSYQKYLSPFSYVKVLCFYSENPKPVVDSLLLTSQQG